MIRALCLIAFLALGGCAIQLTSIVMGLGGVASISTLLKNEANCTLADISACTVPHLKTAPLSFDEAFVRPTVP